MDRKRQCDLSNLGGAGHRDTVPINPLRIPMHPRSKQVNNCALIPRRPTRQVTKAGLVRVMTKHIKPINKRKHAPCI